MNKDMDVARLELVAAQAKQLAEDLKHGRLWDGELKQGIEQMLKQLSYISTKGQS